MGIEKAGKGVKKSIKKLKAKVKKEVKETRLVSKKEIDSNKRDIKYIAIHCAATPPDMEVTVERIRGWHLDRGFSDVGYHYVIYRDGSLHSGRDLDGDGLVLEEVGAHVAGYNSKGIGICYAGGVNKNGKPEDNRTPEQLKTMERLVKELHLAYPEAEIKGHRDFAGVAKACPSFEVSTWLVEIGLEL